MSNFIISLDFELKWGVLESNNDYDKNLYGARKAIPEILDIFKKFNIKSTWAIVGFLFNKNVDEFKKNKPKIIRHDNIIDPYTISFENNEGLYFALDLIQKINSSHLQEIASHTYSHFNCKKGIKLKEEFIEDINAAINIAQNKLNIKFHSIVFPRNEISKEYFPILKKLGFTHYRGNPNNFLYNKGHNKKNILIRAIRYLDSFIEIVKNYNTENCDSSELINVQANRMLRPHNKIKILNFLMIRRIKKEMLYAAKNNLNYHLWWHPHNFGLNTERNIQNLENILSYYNY